MRRNLPSNESDLGSLPRPYSFEGRVGLWLVLGPRALNGTVDTFLLFLVLLVDRIVPTFALVAVV